MMTPAIKKYLFIMYEIAQSRSIIRSVDVSKALGVNKASVSTMLPKLIEEDLITRGEDGTISFTSLGAKCAKEFYCNYKVLHHLFEKLGSSTVNAREDSITCICSLSSENIKNISDYILKDDEDSV